MPTAPPSGNTEQIGRDPTGQVHVMTFEGAHEPELASSLQPLQYFSREHQEFSRMEAEWGTRFLTQFKNFEAALLQGSEACDEKWFKRCDESQAKCDKNTEKIMEQARMLVELKVWPFPLTCLQFLIVK